MLESFLKQFPSLIKSSVQLYFFPRRFLTNLKSSQPQSVLTYFVALSAFVIVLSIAFKVIFGRALIETPGSNLSLQVLYTNGKDQNAKGPFLRELGILGLHGSPRFHIGASLEQYLILPATDQMQTICALGGLSDRDTGKRSTIPSDEQVSQLTKQDATDLAATLIQSTFSPDELGGLDNAMRQLMIKICGNNFLYLNGSPGYLLIGTSTENDQLISQQKVTFPWSQPRLYASSGSIVLGFGLVHTEIAGISPKDVDGKIYIVVLAAFLVTGGFSLSWAFDKRKLSVIQLLRRGFQVSLAIFAIPFFLFWLLSAVLTFFPMLAEYGACPARPTNYTASFSCGSLTVMTGTLGLGGLAVMALGLAYLSALANFSMTKVESLKRLAVALTAFTLLCSLVLAPIITVLVLNYAEFKAL